MTKYNGPDNSGTLFDNIMTKKKMVRDGELAELLGQKPSAISMIRRGQRTISDTLLVKICETTGISLKSARAQINEAKP